MGDPVLGDCLYLPEFVQQNQLSMKLQSVIKFHIDCVQDSRLHITVGRIDVKSVPANQGLHWFGSCNRPIYVTTKCLDMLQKRVNAVEI